MLKKLKVLAAGVVINLAASFAHAAPIVWDWSPTATGSPVGGFISSSLSDDHFAEFVRFDNNVNVLGMDIYAFLGPVVGTNLFLSIWADDGGVPGAELFSAITPITVRDQDGSESNIFVTRLHVDFDGQLFAANTGYWVGLTGYSSSLRQAGLAAVSGGDKQFARFNESNFVDLTSTPNGADLAFRLYGDRVNVVPEPSTLALAALALTLLLARRRQRAIAW